MKIAPWRWEERCSCQESAPCWRCAAGDCDHCAGSCHPRPETWIAGSNGRITRPAVRVWLADRTCRWACTCAAAGHPRRGGLW